MPIGEGTWPSADLAERPYAFYEQLRREDRLWRSPATGEFLVSRWSDVVAVAEDPATFGQYRAGPAANTIAATDGAEHRTKRATALPLVSHRSVRDYGGRIRALSATLVDGLAGRDRVAFATDYDTRVCRLRSCATCSASRRPMHRSSSSGSARRRPAPRG